MLMMALLPPGGLLGGYAADPGGVNGSWEEACTCVSTPIRVRAALAAGEFAHIVNHLLAVLTHPHTARILVALAWRSLELAQPVWPQRCASSRCLAVSSDPGSLLAPYRPFVAI